MFGRLGLNLGLSGGSGAELEPLAPDEYATQGIWFKADTLSLSDTDPVTAWDDSSSNGWDASQGTGSLQPSYVADDGDGFAAVNFDGVDDYLSVPSAVGIMRDVAGFTFLAVAKPDVDKASQIILGIGNGTSGWNRFWFNARGDDDRWRIGGRRLDGDNVSRLSAGNMDGSKQMVAARVDYANGFAEIRVDGKQVAIIPEYQDEGNTSDTDSTAVRIGDASYSTINELFQGNIYEVIAIPEYVDDTTMRRLELGLSQRQDTVIDTSPQNYPYTPTDVWSYKTADDLSLSEDDPVNTWEERLEIFSNVENASGTDVPIYKATGMNGKPSIYFDGGDNMEYDAGGAEVIAATFDNNRYGVTYVFTAKASVDATNRALFYLSGESSSTLKMSGRVSTSGFYIAGRRLDGDSVATHTDGTVPDETEMVVTYVFDYQNTTGQVYLNGELVAEDTTFGTAGRTAGNTEADEFILGNNFGGSAAFVGHMSEQIIYGRALPASEILSLSGQIATEYDFSWNDSAVPVVSSSPTISGTEQVGEILTGTNGSYTNDPKLYTYKWYRDGAEISGADEITYTLVPADEGAVIRFGVTPSNLAGSGAEALSDETGVIAESAEFSPEDIANTLLLAQDFIPSNVWEDTARTDQAEASDNVAAITDNSGAGYHLSQASASNRPIYAIEQINSKDVISYDPSSSEYFDTSLDLTDTGTATIGDGLTFIYVVKPDAFGGGASNIYWTDQSNGSTGFFIRSQVHSGGGGRIDVGVFDSVEGLTQIRSDDHANFMSSNVVSVVIVKVLSSGIYLYHNGDNLIDSNTTALTSFVASAATATIAGEYDGTNTYDGNMPFVQIVGDDVSDANLNSLGAYLVEELGVTWSDF